MASQPKLTIGQVQAAKVAADAKAKNDARIAANRARGAAMQASATARAAQPSQPKLTIGQVQAQKAAADAKAKNDARIAANAARGTAMQAAATARSAPMSTAPALVSKTASPLPAAPTPVPASPTPTATVSAPTTTGFSLPATDSFQSAPVTQGLSMNNQSAVSGMKKGGKVSSASSRGDGIAQRGKTRGRFL